ncbi:MAG TPA: hypothetical protein VHY81_05975 [Acidimicrobiales bacterium]|nr:hypothetical protein [Acidimicrobiales bacterium]
MDAAEVAVALAHIEAVAHDEVGRDVEADVAERDLDALLALLDQRAQMSRLFGARALR